jgi:hypothetical protein
MGEEGNDRGIFYKEAEGKENSVNVLQACEG